MLEVSENAAATSDAATRPDLPARPKPPPARTEAAAVPASKKCIQRDPSMTQ